MGTEERSWIAQTTTGSGEVGKQQPRDVRLDRNLSVLSTLALPHGDHQAALRVVV